MKKSKYSAEAGERAVRMVQEHQADYGSAWARIESIAGKLGCTSETLHRWVRPAQVDQGQRAGLSISDRERLLALERENRQLRQANEILRKASAYLHRRSSTAGSTHDRVYRRSPRALRSRADLPRVADRCVDLPPRSY